MTWIHTNDSPSTWQLGHEWMIRKRTDDSWVLRRWDVREQYWVKVRTFSRLRDAKAYVREHDLG